MLILARKVGEGLHIGNDTTLVVEAIAHGEVRFRVEGCKATSRVREKVASTGRSLPMLRSRGDR